MRPGSLQCATVCKAPYCSLKCHRLTHLLSIVTAVMQMTDLAILFHLTDPELMHLMVKLVGGHRLSAPH